MSEIIMQADRSNGYLHQVKTDGGNYYWVSTTNVEMPLGRGIETLIVKCRKNGYAAKSSFETAKTIYPSQMIRDAKTGKIRPATSEEFQKLHLAICNHLEKWL